MYDREGKAGGGIGGRGRNEGREGRVDGREVEDSAGE